jgi:DNA-binding GntR family transcriptional regulator
MTERRSGGPVGDGGQPVVYKTKTEAAYTEVRRRIMRGILLPDEQINQEEIARSLGVSTTPLREALRRLESEGLVVANAHRDVTVAPLDIRQLADLYDTKVELECYAVALAAQRVTPRDVEVMTRALARQPNLAATSDEAWRVNRDIHSAFCDVCHNPLLTEFLDIVWDRFERYRAILDPVVVNPDVDKEHALIIAAIVNRDPDQAVLEMRNHSNHGRTAIARAVAEIDDLKALAAG